MGNKPGAGLVESFNPFVIFVRHRLTSYRSGGTVRIGRLRAIWQSQFLQAKDTPRQSVVRGVFAAMPALRHYSDSDPPSSARPARINRQSGMAQGFIV